jgi:DNA polymerase epsilon subunit 4
VARQDNLEFLVDIVPRTVPYKQVKEKKAPQGINATNGESSIENGQTTIDGKKTLINGTNGFGHDAAQGDDEDDSNVVDPSAQLEREHRARLSSGTNGVGGQEVPGDVEMS